MASEKVKGSISLRLMIIAAISLVLMIPAMMITSMIREREATRNEAVNEVSDKWGARQVITGPVLTVPFRKYLKDEKGKTEVTVRYAHFLPDELSINGTMHPDLRHRGIYEVVLYDSNIELSGRFSFPDPGELNIPKEDIMWNSAFVSLGVTDMKGIKDSINLKWNNDSLPFDPGVLSSDVLSSGVSTRISLDQQKRYYSFSTNLKLNGSRELNFVPVGKETVASLNSNWNSPSFQGAFLPEKREVSANGFKAQWKVLQLNRNYPQKWIGAAHKIDLSAFGVNLVKPVDQYQKTMRTTKYALMFFVLTFAAFFVIELLNRRAVHPVQYFLVGLALVLFYSLLLSLSEHMLFQYSYLIAAACVVILIAAYSRSMFSSNIISAVVASLLSALYGFLYILLQLEDYALLLGSVGLFVILAAFMYLTRKIDWFNAWLPNTVRVPARNQFE